MKQRQGNKADPSYYIIKKDLEQRVPKDCCIMCGKKLTGRRRKYCSDECCENFLNRFHIWQWDRVRQKVLKRDNYTCVKCGFHTGYNLIVDHIKPIALGGKEYDLDNLQTLCEKCHREKTKKDLKRIARQRRKIKHIRLNDKTVGVIPPTRRISVEEGIREIGRILKKRGVDG